MRSRLVSYVEQMDQVVSQVIANDWVANDARFLLYPAMKELTLDIASMVFMGHEPGTDRELLTKVNKAFTTTTLAGNAIIETAKLVTSSERSPEFARDRAGSSEPCAFEPGEIPP